MPSISTVRNKPARQIVPPILTTDWATPTYDSNIFAVVRIIRFTTVPISVRHRLPITDPMAFGLLLVRSIEKEWIREAG